MSTTDRHDHELEAQLRAVLADRANEVNGAPPDLADVPLVVPIGAPGPAVHGGARRTVRWIAAAAVVGVAGLVAVNALQTDDDAVRTANEPPATSAPSNPSTTTPSTDPIAGMVNPMAPELPASVQLDVVTPIYSGDGDAEDVARAYLAHRFSDGVAEIEQRLVGDLAFTQTSEPGATIAELTYDQDADGLEDLPKGTVFLRQDQGRWHVVAAATDGLSLASVQRDGGRLHGSPVGDPTNPNLGSPLVVTNEVDQDPVLTAGGGAALDFEVGDASALVTAWVAGGRTLGITEFVSDPASLPKVLWAGSAADHDQRRDPESTARAYAAATPKPLPVASTEVVTSVDDPTRTTVEMTLEGGLTLTLELARTTDGWVVTDVHDNTDLEAASSADATGTDSTGPVRALHLGVPDSVVTADLTTWTDGEATTVTLEGDALDAGPDAEHVEQPGMKYLLGQLDPPRSITHSLLVGCDADGTVVTVQASFWG